VVNLDSIEAIAGYTSIRKVNPLRTLEYILGAD
jgi:hypothetical protein